MRVVLTFLLAVLLTGCPTPVCAPNDTKCAENVALICDPHGAWVELMWCDEGGIGQPGWVCCPTDDGCTCLPEEECAP